MTATTSAQIAQTSGAKAPVQIGKSKEEASTNGFANLLANSITQSNKGLKAAKVLADPHVKIAQETQIAADPLLKMAKESKIETDPHLKVAKGEKKVSVEHLAELVKTKGHRPLDESELSLLSEFSEESDDKKGTIKLSDLLAELSHKSSAPTGSEVINLKRVLSSKNDDPNLINKDLLALVPAENRHKVMDSLIVGAKQLLTEQLESRIPKNRVPKTLKGLLETAVRFNLVVADIKLESLPASDVTKDLLKALDLKEKKEIPLSGPTAKMATDKLLASNGNKKVGAQSPLEKMLNTKEIVDAQEIANKQAVTSKEEVLAKALDGSHIPVKATPISTTKEKEKDKQKIESKQVAKGEAKELLANEASKAPSPVTNNNPIAQKGSGLEKLLATEAQETQGKEAKTSQELPHTNELTNKQDAPLVKEASSLNVKMAEARQLVSQLSADVKEAMENYKPPFTKLSMKLNPDRLGDIDVVMIQRGNNVHINLSSNGVALGLLQQNSADLKTALNNVGLSDATMNFSSNGEDRNQQEQQKNHSTSERYAEMSKILDDIDSLEIVVPRYV